MKITFNELFKVNKLPLWIIFMSFGPYVLPNFGLRTEHVLIYFLLPFAIIILMMKKRTILSYSPLFNILMLLFFITLWTLMITFIGPKNYTLFVKVVAYLEDYFQPIAIILILSALLNFRSQESLITIFREACLLFIYLMMINSIIATVSIYYDLSSWISYFLKGTSISSTVWAKSLIMGRYLGIFNQPIEAGLAYSLALINWGYLTQMKRYISIGNYIILFALLIGGILSVSKVFILGGIPLFVLYLISIKRIRFLINYRFVITATLGIIMTMLIFKTWKGFNYFLRLFHFGNKSQDIVSLFTATRFGRGDTGVKYLFNYVWEKAPIYGLGFAAKTPLDNAYLAYFVQGGLIALIGYLAMLTIIALVGFNQFKKNKEGQLLFYLFVLILGGGIGAAVLSLNRISTVFWVLITLILSIIYSRKLEKSNIYHRNPKI